MDLAKIRLPDGFGETFHEETTTNNILDLIHYVISLPSSPDHYQLSFGIHNSVLEVDSLLRNLRYFLKNTIGHQFSQEENSMWQYVDKYLQNFSNSNGLTSLFQRLLGYDRYSKLKSDRAHQCVCTWARGFKKNGYLLPHDKYRKNTTIT